MPSLGKIELRKDAPSVASAGRKHSYANPGGRLKLDFCDPFEFRMGAYAWRLRLLARDVDVSQEHGFLGGDDWRHPDQYQPWRAGPPQLLLVSWKLAAFLYDLEHQQHTVCNISSHISAAAASKTLARVALQGEATTFLLDVKGKVVAVLPENGGQTERPAFAWFDKAGCLLVIGRERPGSPATITFYEAAAGKAIGSVPCDPQVLLPYPASDYTSIGRDRYSLILSRTTRCVGHRLDKWAQVHFDDSRSVLQLQTYRPISEPFMEGSGVVCYAEPRWMEVELIP